MEPWVQTLLKSTADDVQKRDALLQYAAKRLGQTQKQQLEALLRDPDAMRRLLASGQAQALLRDLGGKG